MKMNNPFKGSSSSSALNRNRKQKYHEGLILTGNRHKQQVWEKECDFSYNVTENLFVTWLGWSEAAGAAPGLVGWWRCCSGQGLLYDKGVILLPPAPHRSRVRGARKEPLSHSGRRSSLSCLWLVLRQWDDKHSDVIARAQFVIG